MGPIYERAFHQKRERKFLHFSRGSVALTLKNANFHYLYCLFSTLCISQMTGIRRNKMNLNVSLLQSVSEYSSLKRLATVRNSRQKRHIRKIGQRQKCDRN
jgi:hypothetical protein